MNFIGIWQKKKKPILAISADYKNIFTESIALTKGKINMEYIKKDIRGAIRNAETICLYNALGTENVIRPVKGQDFSNFCKEGLKGEFNKMVIHHKNGGTTTVEVVNRNAKV